MVRYAAMSAVIVALWGTAIAPRVLDSPAMEPFEVPVPLAKVSSPEFEIDIVPILAKSGCNSASCHGAATGQGTFRLSLFCGDPDFDYDQIVREFRGRRVNRSDPAQSLILLKASQSIEHGGGERFDETSAAFRTIQRWLAAGAPRGGSRSIENLQIQCERTEIERVGQTLPLRAIASIRDAEMGTLETRDVTDWTVFESLDPTRMEMIDATVRALQPGRGYVLARFANRVAMIIIDVPLGESLEENPPPAGNWIDERILATLVSLRMRSNRAAPPHALLRRLYLDLTGRIPPPERAREWNTLPHDDTRYEALVDELLQSDEFVDCWSGHLAVWLRAGAGRADTNDMIAYYKWLRQCVRDDVPLVEVMRRTLTAQGSLSDDPAVGFYRQTDDAKIQAERTSAIWMGVQIGCANCHNHPLDRWTRADYHEFAALFAHVDFGDPLRLRGAAALIDNDTGRQWIPKLLDGTELTGDDVRVGLADWLAEEANPYLSRAMANRIWGLLLGRGLFEPFDDWRETNPVADPELLNELAARLRSGGYRLRPLVREIVLSAAYRRLAAPAQVGFPESFRGFRPRRLPLPVILQAWRDVLLEQPRGTIASHTNIDYASTDRESVEMGKECARQKECTTANSEMELPLTRALYWLNSREWNQSIVAQHGWLGRRLSEGVTDAELLEAVYWRALSRPPRTEETELWNAELNRAENTAERQALWQDILWSILTCDEFTMVW